PRAWSGSARGVRCVPVMPLFTHGASVPLRCASKPPYPPGDTAAMKRFTPTVTALVLSSVLLATATACQSDSDSGTDSASDVTGATLHTSLGDIEVVLFPDKAPETVANF